MKIKKKISASLLVFLCSNVFSAEMLTKDWLDEMERQVPQVMCEEGTPYRSCFAINTIQCETRMAIVTHKCIENSKSNLPGVISSEDVAEEIAGELGECVSRKFALVNRQRIRRIERCNELKEFK